MVKIINVRDGFFFYFSTSLSSSTLYVDGNIVLYNESSRKKQNYKNDLLCF